jgi:hypothetical protein
MPYDYTNAPSEQELIPHGTVCALLMRIKPGSAGEDGMLTRSRNGDCEILKTEFTILEGDHQRRKFWGNMVLEGTTSGHAQAVEISLRTLRNIIESVRGINPHDVSPQARTARTVGLKDFDNVAFVGRVGVEKGNGSYPDKNVLLGAVSPGSKEYRKLDQVPPPPDDGGNGGNGGPSPSNNSSAGVPKPDWASQ